MNVVIIFVVYLWRWLIVAMRVLSKEEKNGRLTGFVLFVDTFKPPAGLGVGLQSVNIARARFLSGYISFDNVEYDSKNDSWIGTECKLSRIPTTEETSKKGKKYFYVLGVYKVDNEIVKYRFIDTFGKEFVLNTKETQYFFCGLANILVNGVVVFEEGKVSIRGIKKPIAVLENFIREDAYRFLAKIYAEGGVHEIHTRFGLIEVSPKTPSHLFYDYLARYLRETDKTYEEILNSIKEYAKEYSSEK